MKKYSIEVTEVLNRIVEVESETSEEAIKTVMEMYHDFKIVLDASDYLTTEFSVKDEKNR